MTDGGERLGEWDPPSVREMVTVDLADFSDHSALCTESFTN